MTDWLTPQEPPQCTCICHRPATHLEPSEWEQDPYCPVHPDWTFILAERDRLTGELHDWRGLAVEARRQWVRSGTQAQAIPALQNVMRQINQAAG